jgi:hypothetical protein
MHLDSENELKNAKIQFDLKGVTSQYLIKSKKLELKVKIQKKGKGFGIKNNLVLMS